MGYVGFSASSIRNNSISLSWVEPSEKDQLPNGQPATITSYEVSYFYEIENLFKAISHSTYTTPQRGVVVSGLDAGYRVVPVLKVYNNATDSLGRPAYTIFAGCSTFVDGVGKIGDFGIVNLQTFPGNYKLNWTTPGITGASM